MQSQPSITASPTDGPGVLSRTEKPESLGAVLAKLPITAASPQSETVIPTTRNSQREPAALAHVGESTVNEVNPEAWKTICGAIVENRWPIYLFGEVGRGKSCAMRCVFDRWRGWKLWYEASSIVSDVIQCRSNGKGFVVRTTPEHSWDEWEPTILRKIQDATLVCIDDVGLREPSNAAYEVFYAMVNSRLGKPTIYTGNLNPTQLANTYDKRIASRLLRSTVIELTGPDRRLSGTKFTRV